MVRGAQRGFGDMSEVAYIPVATDTAAAAYTPTQAIWHVMGVRQETTCALIITFQTAASKLQGSVFEDFTEEST